MTFDSLLTRILKVIAVVILVAIPIIIILVEFSLLKHGSDKLTWHWHVGASLLIGFCFCAAYLLIRRSADRASEIYCQRCHTLGGHTEISPYRSSVSGMAWHFGGFLFSIFYSASRKEKFRCGNCGEIFDSHTSTSRAYRTLFLLLLALAVNFLWAQIDEFLNQ